MFLFLQVYKRSFWTESFVQWSPKGSYVTTVHTQGTAVWGGPSFGRIQRFSHKQVIAVFSALRTALSPRLRAAILPDHVGAGIITTQPVSTVELFQNISLRDLSDTSLQGVSECRFTLRNGRSVKATFL